MLPFSIVYSTAYPVPPLLDLGNIHKAKKSRYKQVNDYNIGSGEAENAHVQIAFSYLCLPLQKENWCTVLLIEVILPWLVNY